MIRTKEEKKEIAQMVNDLKLRHLLTWSDAEWDAQYGYTKDTEKIWDKINFECKHHWQDIDLKYMMESYSQFGADFKGNGLHSILQCGARNITGETLSANGGQNAELSALMRYLLHIGDKSEVLKSLREGKWDKSLDTMCKLDPTVVLLQFMSARDKNAQFMPKFGESLGNKDTNFIDEEAIRHIDNVMATIISQGSGPSVKPSMMSKRYKELTSILREGRRQLVRMDIINYVSGCLGDIVLNSSSYAMSEANAEVFGKIVSIKIPHTSWWEDTAGNNWKIENWQKYLLMSRYCATKDAYDELAYTYTHYVAIVIKDDDGTVTAYIEKPELAQRFYDHEDPTDTVAYTLLNLRDKDGRVITDLAEDGIEVHQMTFDLMTTDKNITSFMGTNKLTKQDKDCDTCNDAACASFYQFPTTLTEATYNGHYIYVPYETEACADICDGCEATKVISWIRIPCGQTYEMVAYGETTNLYGLKENEFPVLRQVKDKDGNTRDILLFAQKNIVVDITVVLHPKVDDSLPYGIMLVDSPTESIASTNWCWTTITEARIESRDETSGTFKAEVTYKISQINGNGSKDVTVFEEFHIPRR